MSEPIDVIFYATREGRRIFSLELPDEQARFHDLAKLGLFVFQSQHPEWSPLDQELLFGFERGSGDSTGGDS